MKIHLIIVIAMLMLAGCTCLQRDPCLWAIGNEDKIADNYNTQMDKFHNKYKEEESIKPEEFKKFIKDKKAKLVEVHPTGTKIRIIPNDGASVILKQDEFNQGYYQSITFRYYTPLQEENASSTRKQAHDVNYNIKIKKDNF